MVDRMACISPRDPIALLKRDQACFALHLNTYTTLVDSPWDTLHWKHICLHHTRHYSPPETISRSQTHRPRTATFYCITSFQITSKRIRMLSWSDSQVSLCTIPWSDGNWQVPFLFDHCGKSRYSERKKNTKKESTRLIFTLLFTFILSRASIWRQQGQRATFTLWMD
jgi:hypothetical protein